MAKKIQLQDASGNVLHPLTLGECVTMDNGENLDTLMSKSQMFTPTITQDKSMFKVGTGIDVDYGANVKDGAYESLVFKGKSLVNLLTKTIDTTWNLNLESWSIVSTVPSDCVLKPSTTYSVIVYVTEKTCPDRDDLFWVGDVDGKKDKITHDIVRKNVSLGANVFVINTVPDFSSVTSAYRGGINFQGSKFVEGTLKWKVIVLEGDWTNKELPPYFTGICDSKMPILRNVGKNLFDGELQSGFVSMTGAFYNDDTKVCSSNFNAISSTTNYTLKRFDGLKGLRLVWYDENYNFVSINNYSNGSVLTATSPSNAKYFKIGLENAVDTSIQVQLEESSTSTAYENHKTNILRTSEEIVLREANGVQDTYNPLTGEYVRRIGEVTVDGSTGTWGLSKDSSGATSYVTISGIPNTLRAKGVTALLHGGAICNRLHIDNPYHVVTHHNCVGVYESNVRIKLENVETTVEAYKSWLQSNPITVQYELAEPITTIVKPSIMTPFAYQGGHAIVESGYEGQSLLPEVEYSVVTGRTGQVTQNTKVLRKQEQQIIGLEELLLTQIVQMEYERTLLQFDYELQMTMLG